MLSRRQLRIKAIKALYAHLKSDSDNMIASEKNMMNSIDKTYDLYFQMMTLPVELAHYAQQRQELAKQKKLPTYEDLHPNTRFIDNAVIRMIADSDTVNDRMAARKLGWSKYPELIRTLCCVLPAPARRQSRRPRQGRRSIVRRHQSRDANAGASRDH